jgi:hypothetical protein
MLADQRVSFLACGLPKAQRQGMSGVAYLQVPAFCCHYTEGHMHALSQWCIQVLATAL